MASYFVPKPPSMFEAQSSQLKWCEPKYAVLPFIAEFGNAFSNLIFVVVPPLLIYLSKMYAHHVSYNIYIVWLLLIMVGVSSFYFHATLTLFGQLLDEISILWVVAMGVSFWFPLRYLPFVYSNRAVLRNVMVTIAVTGTLCAFVYPTINAICLMAVAIIFVPMLILETRRCYVECDNDSFQLFSRVLVLLLAAVLCWVTDRFWCHLWEAIRFPYAHSVFHILIFVASYSGCVVLAYNYVKHELPDLIPTLCYWPRNTWRFWGIPYIYMIRRNSSGDCGGGSLRGGRSKEGRYGSSNYINISANNSTHSSPCLLHKML